MKTEGKAENAEQTLLESKLPWLVCAVSSAVSCTRHMVRSMKWKHFNENLLKKFFMSEPEVGPTSKGRSPKSCSKSPKND